MTTSMNTGLKAVGRVEITIDYKDGRKEVQNVNNTVLLTGTRALVSALANRIGDKFEYNITRMVFGDGGTEDGVKKVVNVGRQGLFGITRLSKPVIATLDVNGAGQVTFTSVIRYEDANGFVLNEIALQMANGELYSMVTNGGISKTDEMQLTFAWTLEFI